MNLKSKLFLMMSLISLIVAMMMLMNNMFITIEMSFMSYNSYELPISINFDWMSMLFSSTVMFISSMIIMFSMTYIPKNQHKIFITLMIMFILSMIMLIMSNNVIFMLLGWDGLGLSSYMLVVYYQDWNSSSSGSITILSNRLGDIMILLSISIMFSMMSWDFSMNNNFPMMAMIMMLLAALSKSAQFPFSAWLPAAMSAPTPISALVHSSTLVTAGVYIMIRIMNFHHENSMIILMIISSLTAIYASISALWQKDLKKIIALSTLSQMAMMMFSISMNAINIAYFHLIAHALFKSMMFLCAGSIIHNFMYQDMRFMGSMFKSSPMIISMLGISNLSLMAIPFMSGFFSKDSIIEMMIYSKLSMLMSFVMLLSVMLTSMYSIKMMISSTTFINKSKPETTMYTNKNLENPTLIMSTLAIIMGSLFSWMILPFQFMMIPNNMKIIMIIYLLLGMTIPLIFNNNSNNKLGQLALSLWFIHYLSSNSLSNFNNLNNQYTNNDKMWKEMYGPNNLFLNFKSSSKFSDFVSLSSMSITMLIMLIPIIMFM